MNNQSEELLGIVSTAIRIFEKRDRYLIENDLSERCICARFAMHLTTVLERTRYFEYCVDVEYNRGMDGKERSLKRIDNRPITVDLIVHKRGYNCDYGFDNLICIEMKKSTNRIGYTHDEERLEKMTNTNFGFCYKLGVMLIVNMESKNIDIRSTFEP